MPFILGHRGCAGLEPENTIRAFKRALELGVDFVEFDVGITKDKKLVLIHDAKVDRTTNGRGLVRDFTFEEIRKLNAGKGERIPPLEDAINLLRPENSTIVIEIKQPETTKEVLETVEKKEIKDKSIIVSFLPKVIKQAKEKDLKIKTGIIFFKSFGSALGLIQKLKADLACPHYLLLNERTVKKLHQNNVAINAWTVNKPKDIDRMIKLGVDIITSDYPDRVLAILKHQKNEI